MKLTDLLKLTKPKPEPKPAAPTLQDMQAAMQDACILIGIEQHNRVNYFTFMRNGNAFVIETYSAMEDDVNGWKRDAGL